MSGIVTSSTAVVPAPQETPAETTVWWRAALTLAVVAIVLLQPPPEGLPHHAWYYLAIFAGVMSGLVLQPLPNAAMGLLGVTTVAVLSPWVLFAPGEAIRTNANGASAAAGWALSGFASPTVWLVAGACTFAMGFRASGLGRRFALALICRLGGRALTLGYVAVFAEALLAIVTPSNTARGAAMMYPVLANLPDAYDSGPNEASGRRIAACVLYAAFAANAIASTLFLSGCAANLLVRDFARRLAHVDVTWTQWLRAAAPFAIPLLLAMPLLVHAAYRPRIRNGLQLVARAREHLDELGDASAHEVSLALILTGAALLWIVGERWMDGSVVALLAISLMLMTGVLSWNDMARNHGTWSAIILLATLVTLVGGLERVGLVGWFADHAAQHVAGLHLGGLDPTHTLMALVAIYFASHTLFASQAAHAAAMFPVMLGLGLALPDLPPEKLVLGLALATGISGVLTPYGSGAAMPYYASGVIRPLEFWLLGLVLGALFLAALLFVGIPLLMAS